jgi:hypothetical protein
VHGLFRQVFARFMESMTMSTTAAIPVLLKGEYDRALAGRVTPDALLAEARSAGLEAEAIEPKCIGQRRRSEPGAIHQLYFAIFDAPAILKFRQGLHRSSAADAFDPAAQSPVLFISTVGQPFTWLPMRAQDVDCVARIVVE